MVGKLATVRYLRPRLHFITLEAPSSCDEMSSPVKVTFWPLTEHLRLPLFFVRTVLYQKIKKFKPAERWEVGGSGAHPPNPDATRRTGHKQLLLNVVDFCDNRVWCTAAVPGLK